MKLTPEEKARSAAIMRELLGGTKETEKEPLEEPNRSILYLASFAVIAIGLTFAAAYYLGALRAAGPDIAVTTQQSGGSFAAAPTKLPPLTSSSPPPAVAQSQPARPTLMTYRDPPRQTVPTAPSRSVAAPTYIPPPTQIVEVDRKSEHREIALDRVRREGGYVLHVESVEQVAGWSGRFRTTGEARFARYSGDTPKPKRFEVLTQEDSDLITSVDFAIKW